MLKQLAIVLAATAMIACGEEAVVSQTQVETAPVVEMAVTEEVAAPVATEATTTEEAAVTPAPVVEEAAQEAVATGTVEG